MRTDTLVEHLLEPGSLRVVFQPIVDFSAAEPVVCAVEALTRGPAGGQFERAPCCSTTSA
jgi:EAL domain-containing protein (putative c-di-GMP-specific phosphodiesterase class I)